jgi:hypothetical protein
MIPDRPRQARQSRLTPIAALVAAAFAIAPAESAVANTYTVTSCADDNGPGTLRYIIGHVAGNNDTVDTGQLTCATITLTQGQLEIPQDNLAIEHKYHSGFQTTTTIMTNAGPLNPTPGRILHHTGGGTLDVIGLTLSTAAYLSSSTGGACIYSKGTVSLSGSTLTECLVAGASGGAIYALKSISLLDSTVSSSYAGSTGGVSGAGILSVTGSITLTRSTVSDTYTRPAGTSFGGAIVAMLGSVTLSNSAVLRNTLRSSSAAARGAGIFAGNGLTLTQSTVSYNSAIGAATDFFGKGGGGGVFANGGIAISGSVVDHNRGYYGGGLYFGNNSSVTIADSTIADNAADNSAGGIRTSSPVTLQNSTVAFNRAPIGGGILVDTLDNPVSLGLQSSILADNIATDNAQGADLLVGGSQFTAATTNSLVVSSSVTLPGNPLLACPRLQPLANNGGPTRTLALMHDSPAVDAGNNATALQYDQRGTGYPRVYGALADIGAYEWQGVADDRIFHGAFESGCDE